MPATDLYDATLGIFVHLAAPEVTSTLSLDQQLLIAEAFESYHVAARAGTGPLPDLELPTSTTGTLGLLEDHLGRLRGATDDLSEHLQLTRAADLVGQARRA